MSNDPAFQVIFFRTDSGREPVRDWLKDMDKLDRRVFGEDIKLLQFRWPLGMPLVRKIESDLWEVRSNLNGNRIARVLFTVHRDQIALLHGFIKKSGRTPKKDLDLARSCRDSWLSENE